MWIDNSISKPLREGYYRTLVDFDGITLTESEKDLFNGTDWDRYESNVQFIRYWWASKEDYKIISDLVEKEVDEYYRQLNKD